MEIGIDGVLVGHRTDGAARTGCTVVRFPEATVASGEVRGGAPATREFALLDPTRTVDRIDAVVLSGGSAFGLAAADGVMEVLETEGVGFPTPHGVVPIVVGLSLYDLGVGDASVRPTAAWGRDALAVASPGPELGAVGAGAGATVGKWRGREQATAAGLGIHRVDQGALVVTAIVAVNAVGDVDDGATAADAGGVEQANRGRGRMENAAPLFRPVCFDSHSHPLRTSDMRSANPTKTAKTRGNRRSKTQK